LHDIGHFLTDEHAENGDFLAEDWRHESVGADCLAPFVVESVIRRVPAINVCPFRRAFARVALGGVAASLADAAEAPDAVSSGLLAGPVMTTALDLGGAYMAGRREAALGGGGQPVSLPVPVVVQMGVIQTVESSIDAAGYALAGCQRPGEASSSA
jgi:hypothetical protein